MSHDLHFLQRLERVTVSLGERSLALYRDPEVVRTLLSSEGVHGETRVALALDAGQKPPYAVLAGNGHFVTCLAPGMVPHDVKVIPWERAEHFFAQRRAGQALSQLESPGGAGGAVPQAGRGRGRGIRARTSARCWRWCRSAPSRRSWAGWS